MVGSTVRVYGPSGALVFQVGSAGAVTHATLPASAFAGPGAYEVDVLECDAAGHCTASPRAGLHWDAVAPAAAVDGFALPLGAIAGREGAHLTWPDVGGRRRRERHCRRVSRRRAHGGGGARSGGRLAHLDARGARGE